MCAPASRPATAAPSTRSRSARSGQKLGQALLANRGRQVHALGSLSLDRWQGEERMQFRLIDVASADPVDRLRG